MSPAAKGGLAAWAIGIPALLVTAADWHAGIVIVPALLALKAFADSCARRAHDEGEALDREMKRRGM